MMAWVILLMFLKILNQLDWDTHYILCVQFPNWDQASFNIGDIGYLTVRVCRSWSR